MNVTNQLNGRIVELQARIAEKEREIAPASGATALSKVCANAGKVIDRTYDTLCDRVRRRILFGLRFGTHTAVGAQKVHKSLKEVGKLRIMAILRERPEGGFDVARFPAAAGSGYDKMVISLAPSGRERLETLLSLDLAQHVAMCVCYPEGVAVSQPIRYTDKGEVERKWDFTEILKAALAEARQELMPLMSEFQSAMRQHLAEEARKHELSVLKRRLDVAQRGVRVWSKVHIEDEVMSEVLDHTDRFSSASSTVGGLLLKGSAGTGKTLLAESIADAACAHLLKHGVNTLKKAGQGQSALAVKELFVEARKCKPCVVFIDECDALWSRRGSPHTDAISTEITNTFLAEWNGKEQGIWFIAATNRRDLLDDAIVSRFETEIELRLPNEEARVAILTQEVRDAGYRGALPANVGRLTQGLSGRDLAMLAPRVARNPSDFPSLVRKFREMGNPNVDVQATWETLVLDEETLETLQTTCAMLRDSEAWKARGVEVPTGLLLEGPSGTGKTQIARTIANEGGMGFVKANAAELKGMYLGHAAANVKEVFAKARAASPSILFIDEIDIVTPDRGGSGGDALVNEIISQMLQEMDGVVSQASQVFVLAATNHQENIDPAIRGRFTETIHIPLPHAEARIRLINIRLARAKAAPLTGADARKFAALSEGMSGRDLKNWLALAQRKAVARAEREGGSQFYRLTVDDLMRAKPSLVPVQSGNPFSDLPLQ